MRFLIDLKVNLSSTHTILGIKDYLLTVLLELCITLSAIEECFTWCNPKLVGIMIRRYS